MWVEDLIGAIVTLVLLFVFIGISFIPAIVAVQQQKQQAKHQKVY